MDLSHLYPFCNSELQLDRLKQIEEHGNPTAAATASKGNDSVYRRLLRDLKARAAKAGVSDSNLNQQVPEGFQVKGTSTLYDMEGNPKLQWVKTSQDQERQLEALQAMVDALKDDLPKSEIVQFSGHPVKNLLTQYTITDFHFGMYAWADETGADWDMSIAERTLCDWFAYAISRSPDSETAIFAQIGDFLHWDGLEAVTPSHGHVLDADTRFQKLIRVVIRSIRKIISMLLEKHSKVHVINCTGNHDLASSAWLRELLSAFYDDDPRVTVDTSPDVYYAYEFGSVSLFFHHGHKKKHSAVSEVFYGKFREMLGRTKYSYAHTGHLHHQRVDETSIMTVEQHNTLAAPDAYAAHGGWMSKRNAKVITYHKDYGEWERTTISPDML